MRCKILGCTSLYNKNIIVLATFGKHRNALYRDKEEAVKELFLNHGGRLYAICLRYLNHEDDAKDALQETFVKVYEGMDSFRYIGEKELKNWLKRICINECLTCIRERNKMKMFEPEEDIDVVDEEVDMDDVPPEVIHELLCQLPVGYRTVLNMYVFEQMSHKEISSALGISAGTSMSQLSRAKAVLAKLINNYKQRNADEGR